MDYTVGADYWGENLDTDAHTFYYDDPRVTQWLGSNSYRGKDIQRVGTLDDTFYSLFGRGTWHANDALDVTLALRQTWETKEGTFVRRNRANFDSGPLSQSNRLPSGMLSFNWFAAPNVTPYLTLAYGEKSGGLNLSSGAAKALGIDSLYVKPEKTRSAELGVKTNWLQRKVEWNTALFWSVVEDFQTNAYDVETDTSYLINAGKFRSRGGETQLTLRQLDGLSISMAGTLLDARYLTFNNARCPAEVTLVSGASASCDLSGQRVFKSPRFSYNSRIRYDWQTANNLDAFVSGQWSWRDWSYGTVNNSAFSRIPAYGILNLSTGISGKQGDNRWRVSLWLKNALDETYETAITARPMECWVSRVPLLSPLAMTSRAGDMRHFSFSRRRFLRDGTLLELSAPLWSQVLAQPSRGDSATHDVTPVSLRWLDGETPTAFAGVTWGVPWPQGQVAGDSGFQLRDA